MPGSPRGRIVARVDSAVMVIAGIAGLVFGIAIPLVQHHLYREEEFRTNRASGRKLRALQVFCALAAGGIGLAAFRPDHYDFGPAALTFGFGLVMVALSSTDFERRRIPNKLSYPAIVVAAACAWAWPDRSWEDIAWGALAALGIAIGMVVLGVAAGVLLRTTVTPFGMGDAKLIVLIGLLTGWPAMLTAVFLGVLFGGVAALFFLVRKGKRAVFSYGPYLAAGAVIVMLWYGSFVD